ncbi:unnamed protein product [Orchesella dallaii]|uniref:Uncharacterized protein n=1 Tax=Orchesella dallaii TaxID=48710 RepID=A0ABP1Q760_9HEXA
MSKNIGSVGYRGEQGLGGIGGKNGNKFQCALRSATLALWWDSCEPVPVDGRAENGTDGVEGGNPIGQVFPFLPSPPTNEWKVITDYKGFVLESESDTGIQFIRKIELNSNITESHAKPIAFAQELFNLEKLFHKNTAVPLSINILEEYKLLLRRIQAYLETNHSDLSPSNKKILNFLCASIISKISAMRQKNGESSLIVNLAGFLSAISDDMRKLKEGQVNVVVSERKQKMYTKLEKKKSNAESFIKSAVLPAIEQTSALIDQTINKAIEEINLYIQKGLSDNHQLEIDQSRFESALVGQKLLHGVQVCGTVLELFGVKIAGRIAKVAKVFNQQYNSPIVNAQPEAASLLPAAFAPPKNSLKSMENNKYLLQVSQSIPIQEVLISRQIAKHSLYLEGSDIPIKLSHLQQAFQHLNQTMSVDYSSDIDIIEAREKLEKAQCELISACNRKINELSRRTDSGSLKAKSSLSTIIPALSLADANPALYSAIKPAPQKQRQRFTTKLKEAQQSLKNIENRKQSIYRVFIPIIKSTFAKVQKASTRLQQVGTSSAAELSVSKSEVLQMLKTVKVELKEFVKGLQVEEQITLCLDKLEQSFSLLIELYEQIEKFEEQKELADFIGDVNSPNLLTAQIDDDDDDELESLLTKTELLLKSNLFLWDYEQALNAFKQWVFPFAKNYLHPEDLTADSTITKQDIAQVAELYLSRIERLRTAISTYNTMTVKGDDILIKSYFSSESESSQPFYVWRNEEWDHSIREFLSGKTVNLRAQVWKNGEDKVRGRRRAAIKFKTIELYLKHRNASAQPELDSALNKYLLTMTHSGISYYRVLSDVVVMKGANQTTRYSLEKRCSSGGSGGSAAAHASCSNVQSGTNLGGRVAGNVVYSKFQDQSSDYLLSPYTMWTFELVDTQNSKENADFKILEKYVTELDLELRGDGMYIDEDIAGTDRLKDLNISTYYQVDSSYLQDFKR